MNITPKTLFSTIILSLVGMLCFPLQADVLVQQSFTGATAPGWKLMAGTGTGPSLTSGTIDPSGDGWLRLTENTKSQSSFVYYDAAIPTNQGLQFTFDFVIWGGSSTDADGFTLAIFDAMVTPDSGGYGGSLGYAQHNSTDGLAGGIVGFGFDEFGNFSNPSESREGGPGFTPNSLAIRGSVGDTRLDGYEYQTGTDSLQNFSFPEITNRDEAIIHTTRITIPTSKLITVEWKTEGEEWETLIGPHQCTLDCPDHVKIGYTAGTGGLTSYHEVRNLTVTSVPEPTMLGLLAIGGVIVLKQKKRTS